MPEEEPIKTNEILVVPELPQVPTRTFEGEDGKTYDLMTYGETLKELLEKVRVIEEKILKIA